MIVINILNNGIDKILELNNKQLNFNKNKQKYMFNQFLHTMDMVQMKSKFK